MTVAQLNRYLRLTQGAAAAAKKEAGAFDVFGGIKGLVIRVSLGALGLVLIVLGLLMIFKEQSLGSAAKQFGRAVRGVAK